VLRWIITNETRTAQAHTLKTVSSRQLAAWPRGRVMAGNSHLFIHFSFTYSFSIVHNIITIIGKIHYKTTAMKWASHLMQYSVCILGQYR